MTNKQATTSLYVELPETDVSASGLWSESYIKRPETSWKVNLLRPIAGVLLALYSTPATAIPDVWFIGNQRRDTATVAWIIDNVVGRRITRAEALRLARQIIEQAERERIQLVEWEASRGIQWEQVE